MLDFSQEPRHSEHLIVRENRPFNAEPDIQDLVNSPRTPEGLVYCRNHGPVPVLDGAKHVLEIGGIVRGVKRYTLLTLSDQFERADIVVAMQCAGNRRKAMNSIKHVSGIPWGDGTVCNASWSGYRLADLLEDAGIPSSSQSEGLHVCFESYVVPTVDDGWYGASIPLRRAMHPSADVLIATHMNGKPLSPDHGYPIRVIVPGVSGARWVKWLQRITVSQEESMNFYQRRDYKVLPSHIESPEQAEPYWDKVPAIQTMPCNSAIASVKATSADRGDVIRVKGYALGDVKTISVSADRGKTWADARIAYREGRWSWILWMCDLRMPSHGNTEQVTIWSRATDINGNKQPLACDWNMRGVCYNAVGEWKGDI